MTTRNLTAAAVGTAAGAAVFAALLVAGLVLYQRLLGDSALVLAVVTLAFGAIGGYIGWLLGLIIFSALRGSEGEEL